VALFEIFLEHPVGYLISHSAFKNSSSFYAINEEESHSYQFQVPVEYVLQ
jgi:hypothetical protein